MERDAGDPALEALRARLRAGLTPEQRAAGRGVARVVAGLERDMTLLLARLHASAGENSEVRLVDGSGRVLRTWQSAGGLARELIELRD